MKYFIVINEWNYPTESGRDFVNDFDTLDEAMECAESECENERENFFDVNKDIYEEACGRFIESLDDKNEDSFDYVKLVGGYMLNSSRYEEENMWFRSIVIEKQSY